MDHMNDSYARACFSTEVERCMIELGFNEEANFVSKVRNALVHACDSKGYSAAERCKYLLEMDAYVSYLYCQKVNILYKM